MRIAIIGAGIIGLSIAWHLHEAGTHVELIDPTPANGATHAAAGMLAATSETTYNEHHLTPLMLASAALYPHFIHRLTTTTNLPTGHQNTPTLHIGTDTADRETLHNLATYAHSLGITLTNGHTIPTDHAIIANATNATNATQLSGLPLNLTGLIRNAYGEVIRLTPPPNLRHNLTHIIRGHVNGNPIYLVPRTNGNLILGATTRENETPHVQAGGIHTLLRDGIRLLSCIEEFTITETIARPRPVTKDNAPLLGPISTTITLATGLGRNGILLAPAIGATITATITTPPTTHPLPDITAFTPHRFTTTP
ncbi:FAD-dependent oxidoreductase [Dermatophilus congolensis]|uniref:FAD-dependent oxidoreductase n=1 Tax=Dermatophilus congolensis TaxID=1863 RepID=UPI001AB03862|nr:FAD-dependent oxidoreductase [Dermatophilus congolensis]